ncbi:damage-inducible protein DinB [Aureimonas sp. SA4125]|uniref:DinB family protein n=1 Tax=Aureimonas sp. SA4125 TaxID=2826993 RepID=UPI001CC3DAE8|nr:DinB family protein [Aureimonas sp. SA4125]BDA86902.1 damage-inducible protein DinB [Aureimonas sp. SA4125]
MRLFRALAENNAWSNHRLLTAVTRLGDGEFKAPRTGFFPSLHATLNHILAVDLYYVDALTGGGLGPRAFDDFIASDKAEELRQRQHQSDTRLIAFCDSLGCDSPGCDGPNRDGPDAGALAATIATDRGARGIFAERTDALLLHLFTHQTHHRGQAHAMLSQTSVPPPQLDEFFLDFDAPLRRVEIETLGLGGI